MNLLALLAAFVFVVLASKQIGALFAKIHLPLISGFIFAGIVAGPFVLGSDTAWSARRLARDRPDYRWP